MSHANIFQTHSSTIKQMENLLKLSRMENRGHVAELKELKKEVRDAVDAANLTVGSSAPSSVAASSSAPSVVPSPMASAVLL
ncbi:uncharacterized protein BYT42DRAFT_614185 [Radiomyces spectabilis]|uniref:uncharacterized protein n=1 Tax=Radiomyces spectabilis TaxID=64574 RepID=UPI0022207FE8|nr:uncharacterized protein BYT42DRAFT_614185 [Radiomyces spectabilis]KAI8377508.1 hypothetical protein BYT42DRAFT_614185 [Radiomyces spectabilis]